MRKKTMLTDLYQLTMGAAYFDSKKDDLATFEYFIRGLPQDWGYFISNGIEDVIDYATGIRFEDDDIDYLKRQGLFKDDFLESLVDFRFEGDICAIREGTPVAPNVPIIQATAKRMQAQFLETALLNTANFQTMVATKTNRVVNAARDAKVVEFGLRRAHEKDAAVKGARAAYIGGAAATSNVFAGKEYGIPISGTQAHSFVMSFPSELEAFRAFVKTFPDNAALLIDTYNTLQGARNAAVVGKELEKKEGRLGGVRLDSGNLSELSKGVRKILDDEELNYVKILASSDLNEYKIDGLVKSGARIDGYGVGTEMITAKPVAALSGVYKLVEDNNGARIKLSHEKKTYPGKKQVYRVERNGKYSHDILALWNEKVEGIPLLELVVKNGRRVAKRRPLEEVRKYCLDCVAKLPDEAKEVMAKPYRLEVSDGLKALTEELTAKYSKKGE